ncbi:olfactory receptor 11A1-like [Megalops cyprinoides]|uniref:olfactory receptor 11A1-like n=1 Tax=Megalops cyprinoides TaxID=118141 RepID=UPI001863AAA0|nr:olfactory receptor 11A1-like [Megalops cyprinoides]
MNNSTEIVSFILAAYHDIGDIKYFYFSIVTLLYFTIIFANVLLIAVIFVDRSLHEPLYLFLSNLSVNELYGSTALFPSLLVHIVSDTHEVSKAYCAVQIFCLYTYGSVEYCNLAIMSFDRYVSICYPLQYNNIMTHTRVYLLIVVSWLYSFIKFTITLSLSLSLQLCGNVIHKVYCDNYLLVKLSCSDTTVNNIYGLYGTMLSVAVPLIPISYSYAKILNICLKSSKETQQKALHTCTPHLASLLNFSVGCMFEIVQSRFNMAHVPSVVRTILSVYFLMCTPLFNPIVYGVRMTKIRKACKKILYPQRFSKLFSV